MMSMRVNGEEVKVAAESSATLADVLRDQMGLISVKVACARGECGACTVLIDGKPRMSCITLAGMVQGDVVTADGLGSEAEPLQAAFAEHGALQCGYCTAGQLVHGVAVLRELPGSDDDLPKHVRQRMSGNICRCTGYTGIVDAICSVARDRGGCDGRR